MNKIMLLSTGLAVALAGCDRGEAPVEHDGAPAATAAADTEAVKKLETELFAGIESKKFDAVKAAYASDAVMVLPMQAPMRGAAAIAADYDKFAADPAGKFDGTNESTVVGGDMAYSQGTYTIAYTNPQTKKVENGQGYYVVVYKKQADGSWKIVQDVSSPTPKAG